MYVLRKVVYLDKPTHNYLPLITVDNVPDAMKENIRTISFPVNSPFEQSSCSCIHIMVDNTVCGGSRIYPSNIAQDYLQLSDFAHALSLWIQKGFTLDKTIYKVLHEQDKDILAVFH